MIIANGVPKSGTHCLMAWLRRMGLSRAPGVVEAWHAGRALSYRAPEIGVGDLPLEAMGARADSMFLHGHVHAGEALEGFRVVTIFRDPRNVLVSYVRHQERMHGRATTIPDALGDYCGAPFVDLYRGFLGWRGRAPVLRYEDFPAGFAGDGGGLYAHAAVDHNTRTGAPSDWRDWWDAAAERAWRAAGGPALLEEAGYP